MSSLEQKESKKLNQLVSYSNSPLFLVLTWQTNEFRLPFKQKSFNKRKGQRMKGRDGWKEVSNCSNESKLSFKVLVGKCFHEAETQYFMFEGKTFFFNLPVTERNIQGMPR
jgi:hypothetical protein